MSLLRHRWAVNLLLIAVVAGLVALAVWRPGGRNEAPPAAITALKTDSIDQIRVQRASDEPIVLQRQGDRWRMTRPLPARASRYQVDALLRLATAASSDHFPVRREELAQYGLDKPMVRVWFGDTELRIGGLHPLNSQQYIQVGDTVHVVTVGATRAALSLLDDYFDSALLEEDRQPVALRLPGFRMELRDGSWVRRPEDKTLSSSQLAAFVDEWRHARALTVSRYRGKPVLEQIEVQYAADTKPGAAPARLTIGILARQPELVLYRRDEGLEYRFYPDAGARLLNPAADK